MIENRKDDGRQFELTWLTIGQSRKYWIHELRDVADQILSIPRPSAAAALQHALDVTRKTNARKRLQR